MQVRRQILALEKLDPKVSRLVSSSIMNFHSIRRREKSPGWIGAKLPSWSEQPKRRVMLLILSLGDNSFIRLMRGAKVSASVEQSAKCSMVSVW